VIDTDSSGSGADQPGQDDDVHGFRQIEEIDEPVEKREPLRNRPKLDRRNRDDHLDDKSNAVQARKQPDEKRSVMFNYLAILLRTEHNPFLKDSCGGPSDPLAQLANLVLEGSDMTFLTSGLNDRIRDVAARYDAKVIEVFEVFASKPNELISDDCIHPNDAGHGEIFEAAVEAFQPFLMQ